jgi:hypothetical protein
MAIHSLKPEFLLKFHLDHIEESKARNAVRAMEEKIWAPALAFYENFMRMAELAILPDLLMASSSTMQYATDLAIVEIKGDLSLEKDGQLPPPDALRQVRDKYLRKISESGRLTSGDDAVEPMSDGEALSHNLAVVVNGTTNPLIPAGVIRWYGSLLVSAYTAFECLALDLWIAAVNSRPSLARNFFEPMPIKSQGSAKKKPAKAGVPDQPKNEQSPSLDYGVLKQNNFNLSGMMGDVLRSTDRARFGSFYDISQSYQRAFRLAEDPRLKTSSVLAEILSKSDADIRALENLRNVLLHRGGIVDDKFIEHIAATSLDPAIAVKDEQVAIDGEMVHRYSMAALKTGGALIKFVGQWLKTYPN